MKINIPVEITFKGNPNFDTAREAALTIVEAVLENANLYDEYWGHLVEDFDVEFLNAKVDKRPIFEWNKH